MFEFIAWEEGVVGYLVKPSGIGHLRTRYSVEDANALSSNNKSHKLD